MNVDRLERRLKRLTIMCNNNSKEKLLENSVYREVLVNLVMWGGIELSEVKNGNTNFRCKNAENYFNAALKYKKLIRRHKEFGIDEKNKPEGYYNMFQEYKETRENYITYVNDCEKRLNKNHN